MQGKIIKKRDEKSNLWEFFMIKHIKKGLLMAGILAVVLSFTGCPKEAGGSSGGDNGFYFDITSIEGTWEFEHKPERVVITSDAIDMYNTMSSNSLFFSGPITKILKSEKKSIIGIIVKNTKNTNTTLHTTKDKYYVFYIDINKINSKTSIGMLVPSNYEKDLGYDSIKNAEDDFYLTTNDGFFITLTYEYLED